MEIASIIMVLLGILSAFIISFDIKKNPQSMKIMNTVWVLTALWGSVLALIAYYWFGREARMKMDMKGMDMKGMDMNKHKKWQSVALSTLHCGAGCTLADIIGALFISILPITIFGYVIFGSWAVSYILALIIGIYFQYLAIKEMQPQMNSKDAIKKAAKADFLSLTSWQIGMYGWSAIIGFAILNGNFYSPFSWSFWFSMQIAMLFGFITAYPMNILLIKWGLKKGM